MFWGGLYLYDASSGFEIISPADGAAASTPTRVSWNGGAEEASTQVLVNGVFTGQTGDNYFDLSLKMGDYRITTASEGRFGKTYYGTVVFTAAKRASPVIFIILLLISLVSTLLVVRYSKRLRKAKLKGKGWPWKTS